MYVDVILPLKLPGTLTYGVPEGVILSEGCRVLVPVGDSKEYVGIVLRAHDEPPRGEFVIKPIIQAIDCDKANCNAVVTPLMLRLWQWTSEYYLCTLGDVMRAVLPAKIKSPKRRKSVDRMIWDEPHDLPQLTIAQRASLDAIQDDQHAVTLLHGATASGKTVLYEHLMMHAMQCAHQSEAKKGRTVALYLVPEIALTTQLEERLRDVFGNNIGVFHSKMSDAQRAQVWERQLSDDPYPIILGARSSVFLPLSNLQLIIVDEEHEASYKQQEPAPRYHVRNVALMLGRFTGARVVLGSATPSMESYYHARQGRYGLVELTEKYVADHDNAQPGTLENGQTEIFVEDTKELRRKRLMKGIISPRLAEKIETALKHGEQIILFQNRRGWAPVVECNDCGWVPHCQRCDVSLTMHKRLNVMVCHTCGMTYGTPQRCPQCGGRDLRDRGVGTEKVENEVKQLFPEARISRLDLDSAKTSRDLASIVSDFAQGGADILIGTQMVTKGLDFKRVSVVGILAADTALNVPDFRAYERAYELMAQASGRSGRLGLHSTVVIQTRQPDLPVVQQVVRGDYLTHYKEVMSERMTFCYPPFCRLIDIYFRHKDKNTADDLARQFVQDISGITGVEVLGPDAPATSRIANMYIRKAVVKIRPEANLTEAKHLLWSLYWRYLHDVRWHQPVIVFDVDPMN